MIITKCRAETRVFPEILDKGSKVDHAVAVQKKHGDDGGNGI